MAGHEADENEHLGLTGKRLSTLTRNDSYQKNTSKGFTDPVTYSRSYWKRVKSKLVWEAHHIICEHAIGDRIESGKSRKQEDQDYIEKCLWITDWDINNSHNMIGLPKRVAFVEGHMNQNLCCHQNDHNTNGGYTEECTTYLKNHVWDTLKAKKGDHDFEAKDIRDALIATSKHFDSELAIRGNRVRGSVYGWEHRLDDDQKYLWYRPLSMANRANIRPRYPAKTTVNGKTFNMWTMFKLP